MFPWGTSGVLFLVTAWLKWKKACVFCQGLLNQDHLNLSGHTAGTSGETGSDKWEVVGKSYEVPDIETMRFAPRVDAMW